ncbi:MAG: adenylate kinase [Clostridiales bacterium]|nr:adenylate kinase [Clostridiales bacterium]
MKLIFLGPPGAGKGTQAVKIAQSYQIAHISTGDMLRAEMREGTKLGAEAKDLIERGELVPDDVILGMVKNRIRKEDCKNGFLFDGFPRTIAQAEALEQISAIDYVINIEASAETLIRRISGRRMCAGCGAGYHVSTYADANCKCGAALYQREDDKEETVRNRLVVYERSTKPLIEYYTNKGLLHTVNGNADIDVVDAAIRAVLSK